ncbi:MAG: hypothetical protein AAFY10_01110 [Pseudomonadota bacterium]
MTFDHDGRTFEFNPLFDGWILAFAYSEAFLNQRPVEVRLISGQALTVRHRDLEAIRDQVMAGAGDGGDGAS